MFDNDSLYTRTLKIFMFSFIVMILILFNVAPTYIKKLAPHQGFLVIDFKLLILYSLIWSFGITILISLYFITQKESSSPTDYNNSNISAPPSSIAMNFKG